VVRADVTGDPDGQVTLLVEISGVAPGTPEFVEATDALADDVWNLSGLSVLVGALGESDVAPRVQVLDGREHFDPVAELVKRREEVDAILDDYGVRLIGLERHGEEVRATDDIRWVGGELHVKVWEVLSDPHPVLGNPPARGYVVDLEYALTQRLSVVVKVEVVE
jgi:hypothetical protein